MHKENKIKMKGRENGRGFMTKIKGILTDTNKCISP